MPDDVALEAAVTVSGAVRLREYVDDAVVEGEAPGDRDMETAAEVVGDALVVSERVAAAVDVPVVDPVEEVVSLPLCDSAGVAVALHDIAPVAVPELDTLAVADRVTGGEWVPVLVKLDVFVDTAVAVAALEPL